MCLSRCKDPLLVESLLTEAPCLYRMHQRQIASKRGPLPMSCAQGKRCKLQSRRFREPRLAYRDKSMMWCATEGAAAMILSLDLSSLIKTLMPPGLSHTCTSCRTCWKGDWRRLKSVTVWSSAVCRRGVFVSSFQLSTFLQMLPKWP